eukprot:955298-Prymnesium_polylepis.1
MPYTIEPARYASHITATRNLRPRTAPRTPQRRSNVRYTRRYSCNDELRGLEPRNIREFSTLGTGVLCVLRYSALVSTALIGGTSDTLYF